METSEAELVRQAQAGDRDAFGRLAVRHQRDVFRFLFGLVSDHHAAEELTQEAILQAFRSIRDLQDAASFRPWLVAIARHLARRWLRRRRRRVLVQIDPERQATAPEVADDERQRTVMEALAQLRPRDREVLVLFDIEGLSHGQIAGITGDTEGALRTRLKRARRRLRRLVEALERTAGEDHTEHRG